MQTVLRLVFFNGADFAGKFMYIRILKDDNLIATNFEALPGLAKVMDREEDKLRRNFFIGIISCFLFPFILHSRSRVPLDLSVYVITEIFVVAIALLFYRANLVPVKTIISKTAVAVNVTNEEIIVKTAPLNILIYSEKSNELRFNIHSVKISHGYYPLKKVFNPEGTFKLSDKEKEAFIITRHFDPELSKKIMEMYYVS
jgi:hypothetical protein